MLVLIHFYMVLPQTNHQLEEGVRRHINNMKQNSVKQRMKQQHQTCSKGESSN